MCEGLLAKVEDHKDYGWAKKKTNPNNCGQRKYIVLLDKRDFTRAQNRNQIKIHIFVSHHEVS